MKKRNLLQALLLLNEIPNNKFGMTCYRSGGDKHNGRPTEKGSLIGWLTIIDGVELPKRTIGEVKIIKGKTIDTRYLLHEYTTMGEKFFGIKQESREWKSLFTTLDYLNKKPEEQKLMLRDKLIILIQNLYGRGGDTIFSSNIIKFTNRVKLTKIDSVISKLNKVA